MKATTEWYRQNGRVDMAETNASKRLLTTSEEEVLAEHVLQEIRDGFHVSNDLVRDTARYIACQRNKPGLVREEDRRNAQDGICGKNWVSGFIKDKPDLKEEWNRSGKRARKGRWPTQAARDDDTDSWLQRLQPSLERTKILPQDVYQLATFIGIIRGPGLVSQLSSEDTITGPATQNKVVTIVECVSATDNLLSPFMIQPQRRSPQRTSSIRLGESEHGRPTQELFQTWMNEIFEPQSRDRAGGRYRVLIADPLRTCYSGALRDLCKREKIILCETGTRSSQRVENLLRNMGDLAQTFCGEYQRAFRSIEHCFRRDLVFIYEQARLKSSQRLTLNILVPDGVSMCQAPMSSAEWSQVSQEHEDHDTSSVTSLGILKLIGNVEDDLLHGAYHLEARNRIKQLTNVTKLLLKANALKQENDDDVMDSRDVQSSTRTELALMVGQEQSLITDDV